MSKNILTRERKETKIIKEQMFISREGEGKAMAKRIVVRCPHCGQRLLDVIQTDETSGDCILETKCRRCRKVLMVRVNFNGKSLQHSPRDSTAY